MGEKLPRMLMKTHRPGQDRMRPLHFKELTLHLLLHLLYQPLHKSLHQESLISRKQLKSPSYHQPITPTARHPPKHTPEPIFLSAVHHTVPIHVLMFCSVLFCAVNSTRRPSFFPLLPSCQYLSLFFSLCWYCHCWLPWQHSGNGVLEGRGADDPTSIVVMIVSVCHSLFCQVPINRKHCFYLQIKFSIIDKCILWREEIICKNR